ncbi:hypothetical protein GJU40_02655 [Bacillus lacus]|uniref:Phenylalanyl-tRNA synthetase subunit beta n=1 Tax=Metabacillus lacus TaxID=1983721 RepID=A0A7X2IWP6_9BACI|nr:hypothetical protein [Metabacillus lacus]MRX71069.1 hypothetical protein [Metabacillus lacus]
MKIIKFLTVLTLILAIGGYALYMFGTNLAAEKMTEAVPMETGQTGAIKDYIENDPQLSAYLAEAKNADRSQLPFSSKEEATGLLIRKLGPAKLMDIQNRAQQGTLSQQEIVSTLENNLTEDELLALKVVAYKELYS